ncbi:RloB-like protein [Magnetospirillum fulvum]|uniref:RloB-like protein n=2 Tax=Magnetospirillum fulvum TaxID=1082 RepID=A0A1H6H341_MAGFU|nr:RloB-like protein [Magnetospirillum fulvum]
MARDRSFSLKRKPAIRDPKHRFFIFCEGENTEYAYFSALKRDFPGALIELKIIAPAGAAYTCAEKATSAVHKRGYARDSFEKNDQIWAVFDRDETDRYQDAVSLCQRSNVGIGRSNPCFEIFLILHIENFNKDCTTRDVERYLQKIHPAYNADRKKIPDCQALVKEIEIAERRAEDQLAERDREGNSFGAPSTTVFLLTRAIRSAAKKSAR